MDEYSDAHRHFLQALMSRHVLTEAEVTALFEQACQRTELEVDQGQANSQQKRFIRTINGELQPLGLEICISKAECDGQKVFALVNRRAGAETLACAAYPERELRFLQAIMQEVVTSTRGDISSSTALNLVDGLPKRVSRADAQAMLRRFELDRWLELTAGGRVALHTRCIMEMMPYLAETYPDHVRNCELCNRLCVRGVNCECEARYHQYCLDGMRRSTDAAVKCKKCRSALPDAAAGDAPPSASPGTLHPSAIPRTLPSQRARRSR